MKPSGRDLQRVRGASREDRPGDLPSPGRIHPSRDPPHRHVRPRGAGRGRRRGRRRRPSPSPRPAPTWSSTRASTTSTRSTWSSPTTSARSAWSTPGGVSTVGADQGHGPGLGRAGPGPGPAVRPGGRGAVRVPPRGRHHASTWSSSLDIVGDGSAGPPPRPPRRATTASRLERLSGPASHSRNTRVASSSSSPPRCWRRRAASRRSVSEASTPAPDVLLDLADQALEAELLAPGGTGLDGPVRVEQHPVARLEPAVADLGDGDPQAEREARLARQLRDHLRPPHQQRRRVAGVDPAQVAGGHVEPGQMAGDEALAVELLRPPRRRCARR